MPARWDTAAGALITQLVMAAVLIACAATIGAGAPDASLASVGDMSEALTPFLGGAGGRLVFSLGVLGAGMVAAIVCSLAFAWARARWPATVTPWSTIRCKRGGSTAFMCCASLVARWWWAPGQDLVSLSVDVQVMNALLLPVVLGFLIALAVRPLP